MAWDAPQLPVCRGPWKRERRRLACTPPSLLPADTGGTEAQPESPRDPGRASPEPGSLEGLPFTKDFWRSPGRAHGGHQNLQVEVSWSVGAILAGVQGDGEGVPAHNAQSRWVSCRRKGRLPSLPQSQARWAPSPPSFPPPGRGPGSSSPGRAGWGLAPNWPEGGAGKRRGEAPGDPLLHSAAPNI